MSAVAVGVSRASRDLASSAVLASAGDPSSSRIVYGIVVALLVIGVALVAVAVWVFRQTRVDPEVLAPLETMSDRRWRRLDPASQRRMLDEERPEGAEPLRPATSVPVPDEEFAAGNRPVDGFDDLKADPDDEAAAATGADVPVGVGAVDGGDGPDADREAEASAEEPSVDDGVDADGSGDAPAADVESMDVDELGEPTVDAGGSGQVSADGGESVGVDEPGGPVADPDEPRVGVSGEPAAGEDAPDEPTVVAEESAQDRAPPDGSTWRVEGSAVDDVAVPDGYDPDTAVAPDPGDPTPSGSVDRAGDETPSIGAEAPLPEDLDSTDEPARADG